MLKQCQRIKAGAIGRCGELLKEIEVKHGANQYICGDAPTKVLTRKDAAKAAGLSKDQAVTAIRVANVPVEDFERQIESANPPTVTELARQGAKRQRWIDDILHGADPEDFKIATAFADMIRRNWRISSPRPSASPLKRSLRGCLSLPPAPHVHGVIAPPVERRLAVAGGRGRAGFRRKRRLTTL